MEQKIHQNIINHWLQYFQINEKYVDLCKDIPVLYLKNIDTEKDAAYAISTWV